ncbi:hypothetical protein LCGC14_0427740 [marine sediment metagenome]|uniref:DNA N-6-adenine-methyltransferase (Dam) n=1 Tax=marine sediment metagenome TaxID=412755 RepID=A0A0F9SVE7_9ZZZZ
MSARQDWATPWDFFRLCEKEWGPFDLDVCATKANAKVGKYFTLKDDALKQEWLGICWMNPPYGKVIGNWMNKALFEAQSGALVVCLVPLRADTRWWHASVPSADEVVLLKGRIPFIGGSGSGNPGLFPSCVVVFGHNRQKPRLVHWDWKKDLG